MSAWNKIFPDAVLLHVSARQQDFLLPQDRSEFDQGQKDYLSRELGLSADKVYFGRQVHGNLIVPVTAKDVPPASPLKEADGFVTNVPGIALAVRTADCLPVFLFDSRHRAVGMVHAGWKGTEQKIVVAALETMKKEFGTSPEDVTAAFGPCIRRCCYKVGAEFGDKFPDETFIQYETYFFDIALANRNQLLDAGVVAERLFDDGSCTCCDPQYFSHRRDGETAGRHLSLIMLKA